MQLIYVYRLVLWVLVKNWEYVFFLFLRYGELQFSSNDVKYNKLFISKVEQKRIVDSFEVQLQKFLFLEGILQNFWVVRVFGYLNFDFFLFLLYFIIIFFGIIFDICCIN